MSFNTVKIMIFAISLTINSSAVYGWMEPDLISSTGLSFGRTSIQSACIDKPVERAPTQPTTCHKPKIIATDAEINHLQNQLNNINSSVNVIKRDVTKQIDETLNKANNDYRYHLLEKLKTLENDIVLSEVFKKKVAEEVERRLKIEVEAIEQRIMLKLLKKKE